MTLTLLPDLGDLFRLHPQYNAATVVEAVRVLGATSVLWASAADPDHPLRDALPAAGIQIRELALTFDAAQADADHAQFVGFLNQYPQGRQRLRRAGQAEGELLEALTRPLTLERVLSAELLEAVRVYHATVRAELDEGPGTRWRQRRLDEVTAALREQMEEGQSGVVLVPLDDLPVLLEALPGTQLPDLPAFCPGEASRLRALADRAWQLREEDDLMGLLAALDRESAAASASAQPGGDHITPRAELLAAGAGIALAVGDLPAARERLEAAAHALTDHPRSLPGLVLARLGQVRDAQGERELALRTYRAVLALTHAPQVARQTAEQGLQQPFVLAAE